MDVTRTAKEEEGENDKKLPQLRQSRQKTTKTVRFDT
jgi:hypothetical protein